MKRRETMSILILDLLLLIPGLLGSIDCLITAFSLPESMELWAIALSAVTLFSISLGHQKRDRLTAPLLLLALAIPAYLFRVELYESFRNLWGVLSTSYAKGYAFFRDYVPKGSTNKETVGTALAALTVLEAYLCCLVIHIILTTTINHVPIATWSYAIRLFRKIAIRAIFMASVCKSSAHIPPPIQVCMRHLVSGP